MCSQHDRRGNATRRDVCATLFHYNCWDTSCRQRGAKWVTKFKYDTTTTTWWQAEAKNDSHTFLTVWHYGVRFMCRRASFYALSCSSPGWVESDVKALLRAKLNTWSLWDWCTCNSGRRDSPNSHIRRKQSHSKTHTHAYALSHNMYAKQENSLVIMLDVYYLFTLASKRHMWVTSSFIFSSNVCVCVCVWFPYVIIVLYFHT